MVSKLVITALVLLVIAGGQPGHAVPLRSGISVGWKTGMKQGSPGGMPPSVSALHARMGKKNYSLLLASLHDLHLCIRCSETHYCFRFYAL